MTRETTRISTALRVTLFATVAVAAVTTGYIAAKIFDKSTRFPFAFANRVGEGMAAGVRAAVYGKHGAEPDDRLDLFSTFVPIAGVKVAVPPPKRDGEGGGLTSAGEDVIVLTHDGRLLVVGPDGNVLAMGVDSPANGFDDFYALSGDPEYGGYELHPQKLRYNDVQFIDDTGPPSLLASFTRYHAERRCYTNVVARLVPDAPDLPVRAWTAAANRWETAFETEPCLPLKTESRAMEGHLAGGRMAYAGGGILYLASGDYGWDGIHGAHGLSPTAKPIAQDPDTDYGKVIRIDLASGVAKRLTRGNRNMQGIAIDGDGTLWVVEHGVRGGDELNRIVPGANYGWPYETYGTLYSGLPISGLEHQGRHDSYAQPAFAWLPSIAPSSLAYISGFHDTWDGDLLVGSLRGKRLARVRIRDRRVVFAEEIPVGFRIRYVLQHGDGRVVLWNGTDMLVFLSPSAGGLGYRFAMYLLEQELEATPALERAVTTALDRCIECHSLDEGDHLRAPSLAKIYGAPIGATAYAGYSAAMRSRHGTWTAELLDDFVRDPSGTIPGTAMPPTYVADAGVRKTLVLLLEQLATREEIPPAFR